MEIDLVELKKLIESGHREHIVLKDYLKFTKNIGNLEEIHNDIERLYPKDKELYVELANYYINNNDINKAISCLEKYRENKGENIDVLITLLRKYIDVENFEKAKELLKELSIKKGEEKKINDVLFNMEYNTLKECGLYDSIIEKTRELIESGNREHVVLMNYLKFMKNIGNLEEIHNDIERLYPKDKDLYVELANYYINNDDINKAISCLEKYRENKGENIDVLITLLRKYIDVENFEKVKELLKELSIKNSKDERINNLLFCIRKKENNKNQK